MTKGGDQTVTDQQEGLVIVRVFDAPRELVWRAWTEPEHFARWYGPQGMTQHVCEIDFRVDGRYLYGLRSPSGFEYFTTGTYREIVPPERFVATESLADASGALVAPGHYGMPEDAPSEMTVIVSLEALSGDRTRLTLRHIAEWPRADMAAGAAAGWNGAFDKLEQALAAMS
jgi:uncharacterized protein YndB with AHSA1/START domain